MLILCVAPTKSKAKTLKPTASEQPVGAEAKTSEPGVQESPPKRRKIQTKKKLEVLVEVESAVEGQAQKREKEAKTKPPCLKYLILVKFSEKQRNIDAAHG